jgi:hypothetical protein
MLGAIVNGSSSSSAPKNPQLHNGKWVPGSYNVNPDPCVILTKAQYTTTNGKQTSLASNSAQLLKPDNLIANTNPAGTLPNGGITAATR